MMQNTWEQNKREINQKLRDYRSEMSEMSRLFQRVVMKGNAAQRAKLKAILAETNKKILALLDEIDVGK